MEFYPLAPSQSVFFPDAAATYQGRIGEPYPLTPNPETLNPISKFYTPIPNSSNLNPNPKPLIPDPPSLNSSPSALNPESDVRTRNPKS